MGLDDVFFGSEADLSLRQLPHQGDKTPTSMLVSYLGHGLSGWHAWISVEPPTTAQEGSTG